MEKLLKALALTILLLAYWQSVGAGTVTYQYREIAPAQTSSGAPIHISGEIDIDDAYWPTGVSIGPSDWVGGPLSGAQLAVYGGVQRLDMFFSGVGRISGSTYLCSDFLPEICGTAGLPPDTLLFGSPCCGTTPLPTFTLSFSSGLMSGEMAMSDGKWGNEVGYQGGGGPVWTTTSLTAFGECSPYSGCSGGSGTWQLVVPEPASLALVGAALAGLAAIRRRRPGVPTA